MNQNLFPKIAILIVATTALLLGHTAVMAGQFAIAEGDIYSQNSRRDAVTDIIQALTTKDWRQKPLQYKYDDGSKVPNIKIYEAVIPVKDCRVTVQYFPLQQGVTASSISFFVTETKKEPKKWSVSVNLSDGSLRTGTGIPSKEMILDLSPAVGSEHLSFWTSHGDHVIAGVRDYLR
jgi:hypothetical protein